ncbi:MAG: hypothetical protein ABIG11_05655 [bacterium]
MTGIIVVTHGEFGAYLVEAAEFIVGAQSDGLEVVSISPRSTLDKVRENVAQAASRMSSANGIIFMTDMLGGTPTNVVLPIARGIPGSSVICGININMVVSAFSYRTSMDRENLVRKIIEDGRRAICDVKSLLLDSTQH